MDEQELLKQAMSVLGKRKSEKKAAAVRENGLKATPENRSLAQQRRRERERLEKERALNDRTE